MYPSSGEIVTSAVRDSRTTRITFSSCKILQRNFFMVVIGAYTTQANFEIATK
jgi:hypothetical protein